ncbi:hypothetical protein ACFVJ5_23800 [Nocardia sp. NPDC127606]|uniref:TRADD-N-associated membrane domain-containing protein n=1 Tax=Nocardia sp. NPDC127606 TaxID=3345406 RepID=UPI0036251426
MQLIADSWVPGLIALVGAMVAAGSTFGAQLLARQAEKLADNFRTAVAEDRAELVAEGKDPTEAAVISNAALFGQYHARSLAQSQLSFYFALLSAVVGFAVIVVALWTVGSKGTDQVGVAGVQLTGAVIIEVVAALFFRLSNQSRQLLVDFFDKLRQDRQFEEGLALARDMPTSSPMAHRLHSAIALHLIGATTGQLESVLHGRDDADVTRSAPTPTSAEQDVSSSSRPAAAPSA